MNVLNIFSDKNKYFKATRCFYGNQKLLRQALKKFPKEPNFNNLQKQILNRELGEALKSAHLFMIICANLGLEELKEWCVVLIDLIRRKGNLEIIESVFLEISKEYYEIVDRIIYEIHNAEENELI